MVWNNSCRTIARRREPLPLQVLRFHTEFQLYSRVLTFIRITILTRSRNTRHELVGTTLKGSYAKVVLQDPHITSYTGLKLPPRYLIHYVGSELVKDSEVLENHEGRRFLVASSEKNLHLTSLMSFFTSSMTKMMNFGHYFFHHHYSRRAFLLVIYI